MSWEVLLKRNAALKPPTAAAAAAADGADLASAFSTLVARVAGTGYVVPSVRCRKGCLFKAPPSHLGSPLGLISAPHISRSP